MGEAESKKIGQEIAHAGERLAERVAERIGSTAANAGQRLDAAVDYLERTTQSLKTAFNFMGDEEWERVKNRTLDYARQEPLKALVIAVSTGFLLGRLTKGGARRSSSELRGLLSDRSHK
jgi:ElaB/YqjD/DUF883 family membrane-anchored ribosome-binding protein